MLVIKKNIIGELIQRSKNDNGMVVLDDIKTEGLSMSKQAQKLLKHLIKALTGKDLKNAHLLLQEDDMAAGKKKNAIRELKRVAKEEGESDTYQAKEFIKNPKANKALKKGAKAFLKKKK